MKSFYKVISAVAMTGLITAMLCGCGAGDGNTTTTTAATKPASDDAATTVMGLADISEYVVIDNYKSMTINLSDSYTVTEEMVEQYSAYYYSNAAKNISTELLILDREVEDGDMINLDYVGYKDGVEFDGGSTGGKGTSLWIGSHSYIEGFEEGLVGVMPGETVDLNLTFPENYGTADLAGAEVVFTVTVNGIIPEEEIIGVWAESFGVEGKDYSDVKDYYRGRLEESVKADYENTVEEEIARQLIGSATYKKDFPSLLVYTYQTSAKDALQSVADQNGYDIESISQMMLGISADEYIVNVSYEQIQLSAICRYISEQENMQISDEDLYSRASQYLIEMGYADPSIVLASANMDEFYITFMQEDVLAFMKEHVTVNTSAK